MSFVLTRTLEYLVGIGSLVRDADQGASPSMVNGTQEKAQYLCSLDRQGATLSRIFGTERREKSLPNPRHPIIGII
jgi:hypothetical protein